MNRLTAADVMSSPVVMLAPGDAIPDAARTFTQWHISGAPVVDDDGRLVGMVTEGDILVKAAGPAGHSLLAEVFRSRREVHEEERRLTGKVVADVMTPDVIQARESTPLRELAATMSRNEINRIPIVRDREIVGIVTRNDVLRMYCRTDRELAHDVRDTIRKDLWVDPTGLEIDVDGGRVAVRGEVSRHSDAKLIRSFVGLVEGVVSIDTTGLVWTVDD